jgi:hypothetical protein
MSAMTQIDDIPPAGTEEPFEPAQCAPGSASALADGSTGIASGPRRRKRRPLQFTLRTLFILTTLTAALCSALFATPVWFAISTVGLLALLIPIGLIVAIIHARGYFRTFCTGALFPAIPPLLVGLYFGAAICWLTPGDVFSSLGSSFGPADQLHEFHLHLAVGVGTFLGLMLLCGSFAMLVRWLVAPRRTAYVPSSPCWP